MTLPRIEIAPGLTIPRVLTGLWQIADQERDRGPLPPGPAAEALLAYVRDGFDGFDMADHYGSAELVAGEARRRAPLVACTKWCPEPGQMTPEVVRAGVDARRERLGVETLDLLQFHWWSFEHPAWLDALGEMARMAGEGAVRALGVTNFDAAHLHLALADGLPLATNQVSFSLLDRRAAGPLAEVCAGKGPRLLAYGTLCGGFLTDRWRGRPRPSEVRDWSGMKYLRFIDAAGGWDALQAVLEAAGAIAERHGVSTANVATRWVLDHPAVAAVIVGARLGEREHRADTLRLFSFALDAGDHARLAEAFAATEAIPGDCGDEYRRPPYLTASGDLSHHLSAIPSPYAAVPDPGGHDRARVFSGSAWEPLAGYCRALRDGRRILVSGTTATHGAARLVAPGDPAAQATYVIDKIAAALRPLGAGLGDVVRTRMYVADRGDIEAAARAHGRAFAGHAPANTTVSAGLVGDYLVEIEAEAVLPG